MLRKQVKVIEYAYDINVLKAIDFYSAKVINCQFYSPVHHVG